MSHSPAWQAARAARAARRATDPEVQDRRRQHEARAARERLAGLRKADALGAVTEGTAA